MFDSAGKEGGFIRKIFSLGSKVKDKLRGSPIKISRAQRVKIAVVRSNNL